MAVMKALGLDTSDMEAHRSFNSKPAPASKGKRERESPVEPMRRSSRLAGEAVDGSLVELLEGGEERVVRARAHQAPLRGSEEEHARAEAEHMSRWAGKQGKVTIVGTASYKHTLMRVRTMSEAALGRRIQAIERAKGKVREAPGAHSLAFGVPCHDPCKAVFYAISRPLYFCP